MGAWGTAILSDDLARDVYDDYMDRFNDGEDHAAIRAHLETGYSDALGDSDEESVFWLALARAQWECGVLQPEVLQQVQDIVARGRGLERWREQGGKEARKRQEVVASFLSKIEVPKERPRNRRKTRHADAVYEPGDCLAVPLPNGEYGAALVIDKDDSHKTEGMNLVGLLRYKSPKKPDLEVFLNAPWLVLDHHNWKNRVDIQWCLARYHKKEGADLELVGRIAPREAPQQAPGYGEVLGGWKLSQHVVWQFAWEQGIRD